MEGIQKMGLRLWKNKEGGGRGGQGKGRHARDAYTKRADLEKWKKICKST